MKAIIKFFKSIVRWLTGKNRSTTIIVPTKISDRYGVYSHPADPKKKKARRTAERSRRINRLR